MTGVRLYITANFILFLNYHFFLLSRLSQAALEKHWKKWCSSASNQGILLIPIICFDVQRISPRIVVKGSLLSSSKMEKHLCKDMLSPQAKNWTLVVSPSCWDMWIWVAWMKDICPASGAWAKSVAHLGLLDLYMMCRWTLSDKHACEFHCVPAWTVLRDGLKSSNQNQSKHLNLHAKLPKSTPSRAHQRFCTRRSSGGSSSSCWGQHSHRDLTKSHNLFVFFIQKGQQNNYNDSLSLFLCKMKSNPKCKDKNSR